MLEINSALIYMQALAEQCGIIKRTNNLKEYLIHLGNHKIFKIMAQTVGNKQQTNTKAGLINIDISQLAGGIYLMQVLGENNKSLSQTFIKQ